MIHVGGIFMEFTVADISDIDGVLRLHSLYQIDSIAEEDKQDGFITTAFSKEEMTELVSKEQGLFIAKVDGQVIAYAMAASWTYWSKWPMFAFMVKGLSSLSYDNQTLSIDNSYQYGPVCVHKAYRGSGVFEQIFAFALKSMSARYPILVTFINKINQRSYAAHVGKVGLDVLQEFEFNNNSYYELACKTTLD